MELSVKRVYATQKEDLKHAEVMTKSHFYERIDKKNSQHITNTLAQHEFVFCVTEKSHLADDARPKEIEKRSLEKTVDLKAVSHLYF